MLAHNLKEILELIPEARDMVKKASVEQEFPTDNIDSVCASYLRVGYLTKVAQKVVDQKIVDHINKAAQMYKVAETLSALAKKGFSPQLEKAASTQEKADDLLVKFEEALHSFQGLEKTAEIAEQIVDQDLNLYHNEAILRYSGKCWLNKTAAVRSLANRYYATKDSDFVKIAELVNDRLHENDFDNIRKVCHAVTHLDKKAGLDIIGFNFYKEALVTKVAALPSMLTVDVLGTEVPYESILKFGKDRLRAVLGDSVADSFTDDPVNNKYMIESLPRDSLLVLKNAVKGI